MIKLATMLHNIATQFLIKREGAIELKESYLIIRYLLPASL